MSIEPLPVLERLARVEGRVEEHSRMVEDIAGRFTNLEARLDRVEANVNARFTHMEESVSARFTHMEESVSARFERVDRKLDGFREELDRKMTNYFTWTVGLIATSWLSTMYQMSHLTR